MREAQFRAQDHADQMPSGAYILASGGAMDDLLDRLHNGDPTKGWEGDPRLALAYNRQSDCWELWRREYDDQYRLVALSRKSCGFPPNLIENLMSIDGRRGYDIVKDMETHREMAERLEDYKFTEKMRPKTERLAWALKRDLDI